VHVYNQCACGAYVAVISLLWESCVVCVALSCPSRRVVGVDVVLGLTTGSLHARIDRVGLRTCVCSLPTACGCPSTVSHPPMVVVAEVVAEAEAVPLR